MPTSSFANTEISDPRVQRAFWARTLAGAAALPPLHVKWGRETPDAPPGVLRVCLSGSAPLDAAAGGAEWSRARLVTSTVMTLYRYTGLTDLLIGLVPSGLPVSASTSLARVLVPLRVRVDERATPQAWESMIAELLRRSAPHEPLRRAPLSLPLPVPTGEDGWPELRIAIADELPIDAEWPVPRGGALIGLAPPGTSRSLVGAFDAACFDEDGAHAVLRTIGLAANTLASAASAVAMAAAMEGIVAAVEAGPKMGGEAEAEGQAEAPSAGDSEPALDTQLVSGSVAAIVTREPERIAVRLGEASFDYAAIDRLSTHVAAALRAQGARPGALVALLCEPGVDWVAGMLGVFEAGGVCWPAEPASVGSMVPRGGTLIGPVHLVTTRTLRETHAAWIATLALPHPAIIVPATGAQFPGDQSSAANLSPHRANAGTTAAAGANAASASRRGAGAPAIAMPAASSGAAPVWRAISHGALAAACRDEHEAVPGASPRVRLAIAAPDGIRLIIRTCAALIAGEAITIGGDTHTGATRAGATPDRATVLPPALWPRVQPRLRPTWLAPIGVPAELWMQTAWRLYDPSSSSCPVEADGGTAQWLPTNDRGKRLANGAIEWLERAVAAGPPGEVIEAMASLWADLLRVPAVSADDDFFALGGHSLLALQLIARIRQVFQIECPLADLFEAPTVAALSARLLSWEKTPGQTARLARVWRRARTMTPDEIRAQFARAASSQHA